MNSGLKDATTDSDLGGMCEDADDPFRRADLKHANELGRPPVPADFAGRLRLIDELNQLIMALNERISRSRNAMGNLAHALKTPLSALQQLCDGNAAKNAGLTEKLQDQLTTINERINNELKRARIAGASAKSGQLNIRNEVIDLIVTLQKIYGDKAIETRIEIASELYFNADRQDFLELAGNLLDNAFKWASHKIRISSDLKNQYLLIVEDDGPGCDLSELTQLTQRGKAGRKKARTRPWIGNCAGYRHSVPWSINI